MVSKAIRSVTTCIETMQSTTILVATLWAVLMSLALLSSRATAVDCQQLADDRTGCDFYPKCLEATSPCGPSGYALGYGDKYCVRFGEDSNLFDAAVSY